MNNIIWDISEIKSVTSLELMTGTSPFESASFMEYRAYKIHLMYEGAGDPPPNSVINLGKRRRRRKTPQPLVARILSKTEQQRERITKEVRDAQYEYAKEAFLRYSMTLKHSKMPWTTNVCVHEHDLVAKINKNKDTLSLMHQRNIILRYLHETTELTSFFNYVNYEVPIQIATAENFFIGNDHNNQEVLTSLLLSCTISETAIVGSRTPYRIEAGSAVTLSHHQCRIRRNTFCFIKYPIEPKVPLKNRTHWHPVRYNENLLIRFYNKGAVRPLYLRCCERANTEVHGEKKSGLLLMSLSELVNDKCVFQIVPVEDFKVEYRDEVPTYHRILIRHNTTQRIFTVDEELVHKNLVVGREIRVSCIPATERKDRKDPKNHFVVRTGDRLKMNHYH